jgi:hypothetical protein
VWKKRNRASLELLIHEVYHALNPQYDETVVERHAKDMARLLVEDGPAIHGGVMAKDSLLDDVLSTVAAHTSTPLTWFEKLPPDAQAELDAVRQQFDPSNCIKQTHLRTSRHRGG